MYVMNRKLEICKNTQLMEDKEKMGSIVIGVAGGSGSGKSTFTNRINEYFGDDVVVLYHDNY